MRTINHSSFHCIVSNLEIVCIRHFSQEDSKIYSNARYLERFFDEQLMKWLPYCASKHSTGSNNTRFESTTSKRPRYNDDIPLLIGDDDDVILA